LGEARTNPIAMAKARGQQAIQVVDLGDGVCFAGFEIKPMFRPSGGAPQLLVAGLFAVGGYVSPVAVGTELRSVLLCEIGGVTVEQLKKALTENPAEPVAA
jgi:hypothetical protein